MKKFLNVRWAYPVALLALPVIASAQGTIEGILDTVLGILGTVVPILFALAIVYFLFGALKYVIAKEPDAQKEARGVMINGIIVIFVMVSVWGLVFLIGRTFDIGAGVAPTDVINQLIPTTN